MSLIVTLEAGLLRIEPTGQQKMVLAAESNVTVNIRGVGAQLTFTRDAGGTVTGLIVRQGGTDQVAPKIR